MPEWLVLLRDAEDTPEGLTIIAQSGRVAVCEAPPGAPPPGNIVEAGALPPSLTEGERLFAEGWLERQSRGPKERKGEGLPWDAPGFQPPDRDDG